MKRFGVDEVIIGDLTEQRHAGRSVAWLWTQTLGAVAVAILADIRRHPIAAVQAVIVGLILREAHKALWSVLWHYANVGLARSLPRGFMPLGVALSWTDMLMAIPGWIAIGWLLARLTRPTHVIPYIIASGILIAPDLWRQASNAIEDVRFRPYFYISTARETLFTLNVLIGALLPRRRHGVQ
jgi:hypothetical protein